MNLKDEQGNTILHLATWKKQRQASTSLSLFLLLFFQKTELGNCTFMDSFVLVLAVLQITIEHLTISVSVYIFFFGLFY